MERGRILKAQHVRLHLPICLLSDCNMNTAGRTWGLFFLVRASNNTKSAFRSLKNNIYLCSTLPKGQCKSIKKNMVFFLKLMFRYLFLYPFSSCQASPHLSRCCYIIPKTFISPFESLCSANDSPICGRIHCFFFSNKSTLPFLELWQEKSLI